MGIKAEEHNRTFVLEAFDTLADRRDFVAGQRFWSPDNIQHSAHLPPGRDGLFNLVKASPPDSDSVMLHARLSPTGPQAAGAEADPR